VSGFSKLDRTSTLIIILRFIYLSLICATRSLFHSSSYYYFYFNFKVLMFSGFEESLYIKQDHRQLFGLFYSQKKDVPFMLVEL
jgi:hypothetical protein